MRPEVAGLKARAAFGWVSEASTIWTPAPFRGSVAGEMGVVRGGTFSGAGECPCNADL